MASKQPTWYARVAKHIGTSPSAARSRKQEAVNEAREALRSLTDTNNSPQIETLEDKLALPEPRTEATYHLEGDKRDAMAALERLADLHDSETSEEDGGRMARHGLTRVRLTQQGQAKPANSVLTQLATRYATHAVLIIIAIVVAAGGGFKALSVQAAQGTIQSEFDESNLGAGLSLDSVAVDPSLNSQSGYIDRQTVIHTDVPKRITTHKVVEGDTVDSLAQKYGISPDTIAQANGILDKQADLPIGQDLTILPISGTYHQVQEGESLDSIARKYLADPKLIVDYKPNAIKDTAELKAGQMIVVPNGKTPPRDKVITHKIQPGETLTGIALNFDISADTIIWVNDIADPDSLEPGKDLVILPISGYRHEAKAGETIQSIADLHKADPKSIVDYAPNGLKPDSELQPGQVIFVPGGQKPEPPKPPEPPRQVASRSDERPAQQQAAPAPQQEAPAAQNSGPVQGSGQFVWPAQGRITQYFSGRHNGLDIAAPLGTPVVASDGGLVTVAGWDPYGLGNYVMIDHGNGFITVYGHASKLVVSKGQYVERGQLIMLMGSTGNSTGPHVHFILKSGAKGYQNPLSYLQ